MKQAILFVDDEVNVLDGLKRQLRKRYDVSIAVGSHMALEKIREGNRFAVVVTDMRMPQVDGVEFLTQFRHVSPHTTRIMLTGNADQQTAMDAVNEGHIFRFLTKPCPLEKLTQVLDDAIHQYHLVTGEKQLLENTLKGSIKILTEVLSLVNPTAFGHASRVQKYVKQIASSLNVQRSWQVEIAAMLSMVGCVTVPQATLEKMFQGQELSDDEQSMLAAYPQIGSDLISNIPRLEEAAQIIGLQKAPCLSADLTEQDQHEPVDQRITTGAQILKVAFEYDLLCSRGLPPAQVIEQLYKRPDQYDQTVISAMASIVQSQHELVIETISLSNLSQGMVLAQDLYTKSNILLVKKGHEVTLPLRQCLRNYFIRSEIVDQVQVYSPPRKTAA